MTEKEFDVFLSYNSNNRVDAQALAEVLEQRGLHVFWDRHLQARAGHFWGEELERCLSSSRAVIALVGDSGLGKWQWKEVFAALDLQDGSGEEIPVIPVLLPRARLTSMILRLNTHIDLQEGVADSKAIDDLVSSIRAPLPRAAEGPDRFLQDLLCPYQGFSAFQEEDAELFFGRGKVISQLATLVGKVSANPFVALVGSSGSGKTSVVQAGLLPFLRANRGGTVWDFVTMKSTKYPFFSLATALFPELQVDAIGGLAASLQNGSRALSELIMKAQRQQPRVERLLLIVDRWEDLYTLRPEDDEVHNRFVDQLHEATSNSPLSVVCILRPNFSDRALDETGLSERSESPVVHLDPMTRAELREVVEGPARKVGLEFDQGLVDRILDDVGAESGQLPLLEFVLTELWEKRSQDRITSSAYQGLGRAREVIVTRAEEIFSSFGVADQAKVRRLFLQLVRPGDGTEDTRRRLDLREIGEDRKVLPELIEARLLTTLDATELPWSGESEEDRETTIEITHEALIKQWSRLRKWLYEERPFLRWRERLRMDRFSRGGDGQDAAPPLTGSRLVEAQEWLAKERQNLSGAEIHFIEESSIRNQLEIEESDRQRRAAGERKARRRKLQLQIAIALALLFLGFAIFGFWRWRLSLSRALAAEASGFHEGPLDLALLLALQAGEVADSLEARGSLLKLLEGSSELQAFLPGHGGPVDRVAFSPDGRRFATAGKGQIFLWDSETGARLNPPIQGHAGQVLGLAFSPDGTVLASCGADRKLLFWRVGDHLQAHPPVDLTEPVRNLAFSPDGSLLVASSKNRILLWSYPALIPREPITAYPSWIFGLAFRRDGLLASSGNDGVINLWRSEQGTKIRSFTSRSGQVLGLAFRPDGQLLASVGVDRMVRLWNPETGEQMGEPTSAHRDAVMSVAFSADGKRLASAGLDNVINLWNVEKGAWSHDNWRPVKTLFGHGAAVWSLSFGSGGHLVSGGSEESAILWNLDAPPRFVTTASGIDGEVDSIAYSPDGQILFAGDREGRIRLWDTVSHRARPTSLRGHQGAVVALALHDQLLVSAGEDGRLLLWNLADLDQSPREPERSRSGASLPIRSLALSRNGTLIAAGDSGGYVRLWQAGSRRFLGEMSVQTQGVSALAFSRDGQRLASGDLEGLIHFWDVKSRRPIGPPLRGHDITITGLAFDPEGRILASSSSDKTVRLWNASNGHPQWGSPLKGPEGELTGIAFSPQGDRIAASGIDGVFVWDVATRSPLGAGMKGTDSALSVAFSPDGKRLAAGGDKALQLFDLNYAGWKREACQIVGRYLTLEERNRFLRRELIVSSPCPDMDPRRAVP